MFVIREVFTARPGMASKLAKLFKEAMKDEAGAKTRVLTDFVGSYNTVVVEFEFKDLVGLQKMMTEREQSPGPPPEMKGYTDMYLTGRREIYRVQ